jgi:hypothetical protein
VQPQELYGSGLGRVIREVFCGHYSHSSSGTEECFYGSSIPEWYWNGSTLWLTVREQKCGTKDSLYDILLWTNTHGGLFVKAS